MTAVLQGVSFWRASTNLPNYPSLSNNRKADVCVVGAGISGLCTAYRLAKAGLKVVVLTQASLADSESGNTTAHLTYILDKRYFDLEKLHGEEGARLAAESHRRAIDWIEQIVREEKIDCDFVRCGGYLFSAPGQSNDELDREYEVARRLNLNVQRAFPYMLPFSVASPALNFPNQARFHPLKFAAGLVGAIERMGGEIFCDTHVEQVEPGLPIHVKSDHAEVMAQSAVIATGSPINNRVILQTKQAAYRTYVIGARLAANVLSNDLFWDTASPYHYVRTHSMEAEEYGKGHVLLIVGGEDHKTGQSVDSEECYERLESWMRQMLPLAGEIEYRWSGQILEPVDGLAYIGQNPGDDRIYVITGTSGNGMTYGAIGGMLVSDLILNRDNKWAKLYAPSRINLGAAKNYLQENLNVAAHYAELVTSGEINNVNEIPPDSGAVIRRGFHKDAVYRDEQGNLHRFSAICPHLGCVVHWNSAEHSWDCPCHGSRYNRFGKVINGPSIKNLQRLEETL